MNHRQATIQVIRDLARDCARGGVYSGHEIARALSDVAGYVEQIPDVEKSNIEPPNAMRELQEILAALHVPTPADAIGEIRRLQHPEKPVPDIRPASELTPERIAVWTWWCLFDEATDEWRVRRVVFGRPSYLMGVGTSSRCYPLRSEDPWDFASWSEVDAAVKAKGDIDGAC